MSEHPEVPHLLVVDDDAQQRELLCRYLNQHEFRARPAPDVPGALMEMSHTPTDLVISDIRMPGQSGLDLLRQVQQEHPALPVLLITAFADVRDAVNAMRDGASDYLEKPIDLEELLDTVRSCLGLEAAEDTDLPDLPPGIVARSATMRDLLQEVTVIAPAEVHVLITGEHGCGKESIADLLQTWSTRTEHPYRKVNCAAIPETVLDAELFGQAGGRAGLLAETDAGTLFLDEIGELPLALQAKLLHFTQTGHFLPVGAHSEGRSTVRLLAACDAALDQAVEAGTFRQDLYFRLNTFELYVPPLRHRREDILPLANHFAGGTAKRLSASVASILNAYDWPGNVRELRNALERAVLMASAGDVIMPEHLPKRIRQMAESPAAPAVAETSTPLEELERLTILQTLKKNDYNRSRTAKELGLSRRALTYKIRRLRDAGFAVDPE